MITAQTVIDNQHKIIKILEENYGIASTDAVAKLSDLLEG
jgi:hypothetical protein